MISHYNFAVIMCTITKLIIFILFIALIVFIRGIVMKEEKPYPKKTMDIAEFKTGDLVSIGYIKPVIPEILKLVTGSKWNHVGIVYVNPENGVPYIIEGAGYRKGYNDFFMIPLVLWTRINRGHYLSIRHIKGEVDSDALLKAFNDFKDNAKLGGIQMNLSKYLRKIPYDKNYYKAYTCYEGAFRILQDAGIYKKSYKPSYYRPPCMMNRDDLTDDNYSYEPTYELVLNGVYARSYIH